MGDLANLRGDTEMGCCSCLGFLLEPIKSVRSFHGVPNQFSLTDGNEDGDGFLFAGDPLEGHMRLIKSRPVCRLTPVKETRVLILDKDEDGRKIINEYIRERTLRVGSLCKVVLYQNSKDGKRYAVKAFYKSRLMKLRVAPSETAMTDVLREVSIMKMVEHPNIVNLIEVIDDSDQDHFYMGTNQHDTPFQRVFLILVFSSYIFISCIEVFISPVMIVGGNVLLFCLCPRSFLFFNVVLEYVEGDCICEGSGPPGGIGEDTARGYFRDIVAGLMYLHAHNIVHGDIKPENLLVTSGGRVKIADFGVSHVFEDDNDELRRSPGTPVFTAPECCSGLTYHGKAADTWALGVTLYCLLLGQCPFIGDTLQETFDKIVNDPLPLPRGTEPELKNLFEGLLCKDPRQRFSLNTVAGHPWVVRGCGPIPRSTCRCKL